MVEVVVGAAAVTTLWNLVASHAYIGGVAELKAVLAHRVLVVGVPAFCLAGPVVNALGGFLSWDASWNGESWFLVESGHNCYKVAF